MATTPWRMRRHSRLLQESLARVRGRGGGQEGGAKWGGARGHGEGPAVQGVVRRPQWGSHGPWGVAGLKIAAGLGENQD